MGEVIGERSEGDLLKLVQREIRKKAKGSEILSDDVEQKITKFDLNELTIGRQLGRGGFCVVNELERIQLTETDPEVKESNGYDELKQALSNSFLGQFVDNGSDKSEQEIVHNREYMAKNFCEKQGPEKGGEIRYNYVVKVLREDARKEPESFVRSVIDLTLESRFLAVLQHNNIVSMKAMANTSPYKEGRPYFIILEKLEDVLSSRLQEWKARMPSQTWPCCVPPQDPIFWMERLQVGLSIASALEYLHGRNVIYRDIKPDNVGFSADGQVKLFDFGLAREMQKKLRTVEGTYHLTGGTGFPPYMAPEIVLDQPYNESVDVHSFCILLWQLLKVEAPFGEDLDDNTFVKQVVKGGDRPPLDNTWPDELLECLKLGWSELIVERPSMTTISKVLRQLSTTKANGSSIS
mmetsp:Transcript_16031/g.44130  ORF Transcript_16031/g.44130 Transcript_16031/m.44130 type:complete len:408 (-) Transcript_16031:98-1321(-)